MRKPAAAVLLCDRRCACVAVTVYRIGHIPDQQIDLRGKYLAVVN